MIWGKRFVHDCTMKTIICWFRLNLYKSYPSPARSSGLIRNAWHHGGPTSPFIHLVSAFCFLLPRIIIEAKLIEVGFLSRGLADHDQEDDGWIKDDLYILETIMAMIVLLTLME